MADVRSMKITSLRIDNFMRLSAVEVTPTGNVVEITGKNAVGKSSILNAIWALIGGKAAIPGKPIRKGEKKAVIRAALGDLIVTRTFADKEGQEPPYTTSVTIEAADGARYAKPQDILNGFMGALSFDPLALTRMKPKEQFDTFRKFVTGVDLDAIAAANAADYDQRTEVNRRAKNARTRLGAIVAPIDTPAELVDEQALVEQIEDAGQVNLERERDQNARTQEQRSLTALRSEADQMSLRAIELRKQAEQLETEAAEKLAEADRRTTVLMALAPIAPAIDTAAIRTELQQARQQNERYRAAAGARAELERLTKEAEAAETESAELTKAMSARDAEVAKAIAASSLPVEGITFGDGVVLLNDLPFDQASQAEQLRASVAVAAAMNPKLRVALVRDGSVLDEDSWKLLGELADHFDFQVWIESVQSGHKGAVVIEDGHLAAEKAEFNLEAAE